MERCDTGANSDERPLVVTGTGAGAGSGARASTAATADDGAKQVSVLAFVLSQEPTTPLASVQGAMDHRLLDRGLRQGCPAEAFAPAGCTHEAPLELLDAFTSIGHQLRAAGTVDWCGRQRSLFAAWVATKLHCDVRAVLPILDPVIEWLRFAHLGCVTACTPAAWVLAWAGCPFLPEVVCALQEGSMLTADHWVTQYRASPEAFASWLRELLTSPGPVEEAVARHALQWVKSTAAETRACAAWYVGPGRDASFRGLQQHWLGTPAPLHALRQDLAPCLLCDVLALEDAIKGRLPSDIRRVLLEIGDPGKAVNLFGAALAKPGRVFPGMWRHTADVVLPYDGDDFDVDGALGGSMFLGAGGGADSMDLVLVLWGACRGQVWVLDRSSELHCTIRPFAQTPWGYQARPESDTVQALMSASGMRGGPGGP
jgi:hypothetical protein